MASAEERDAAALGAETRRIWEQNAVFWDSRFGEGNDFHRQLVEPASDRLLELRPGERVLEIACGNGAYARHLAALGARVLATDFSERFLALARERTHAFKEQIDYRRVDATDETALIVLGERGFDAAVANMALMDMVEIAPLFSALARLLRPAGRFVFTIQHPCFNNSSIVRVLEQEEREGQIQTQRSYKISRYLGWEALRGIGIIGQPEPHFYFDRPLSVLLGVCFRAGFVLDALEEPAFSPAAAEGRPPLALEQFPEFPPVLAARLRLK